MPERRAVVRTTWEWLGVGCAAWGMVLTLVLSGAVQSGDNLIYDQLARLARRTPSDRILIVAIDDASLAALGPWPWPRRLHARLIQRLGQSGAAGVADDALFVDPDPQGGDQALAAAMRQNGRVVLPVLTAAPGENGRAVVVTPPIPPLAKAAAALGHVDLPIDADGVARRFSPAEAAYGVCRPSLAVVLLSVAGQPGPKTDCPALKAASQTVNGLLASPPRLIPFAGPPGTFRTAPAAEVLNGALPEDWIRGRLVLIGATAAGLGDRHMTATSGGRGAMAGVEIQANILDAALRKIALAPAPRWLLALLSLVPVTLFMAALLRLRPSANMLVGLGLAIGVLAISGLAFFCGVWLAPCAALAGLLLAYPLWSWRRLSAASAYLGDEIARFEALPTAPRLRAPSDILERQVDALARAADHLRTLSMQMADALQSLPDAALLIDIEGAIALANAHAAALAGVEAPEQLQGTPLHAWLTTALGDMEGAYVMDALTRGETSIEATSRSGVDYEASQAGLSGQDGRTAGMILRLADISAIRRALRQREETLQLLTHDIRAPIASIIALAQERGGDATAGARINAYAERALAMAEGYVQFARAESYRFDPVIFDLAQAALDAADEIWPRAEQKGVAVDAEAMDEGVLVVGDPSLIARALTNLLDNGVKFTPSGTKVSITVRAEGGEAVCHVVDQGPGLAPSDGEALFAPFNRGEGLKLDASGAGLGLAMVHAAVKRHGGVVTVLERRGGAGFEIRLPLAGRDAAPV